MEEMLKIFALALRQKASQAYDSHHDYYLEEKYKGMACDLESVVKQLEQMEE